MDRKHSGASPGADAGRTVGELKLGRGERLRLRVFVDGSVVEIYANGRACLTDRVYPTRRDSLHVGLLARGSGVQLTRFDAWTLRPISPNRLAGPIIFPQG